MHPPSSCRWSSAWNSSFSSASRFWMAAYAVIAALHFIEWMWIPWISSRLRCLHKREHKSAMMYQPIKSKYSRLPLVGLNCSLNPLKRKRLIGRVTNLDFLIHLLPGEQVWSKFPEFLGGVIDLSLTGFLFLVPSLDAINYKEWTRWSSTQKNHNHTSSWCFNERRWAWDEADEGRLVAKSMMEGREVAEKGHVNPKYSITLYFSKGHTGDKPSWLNRWSIVDESRLCSFSEIKFRWRT